MTNGHATVKEEVQEEVSMINTPDGKTIQAVELEFEQKTDPWIIVNLSDGTVMRVRLTIMKVYRAVGEYNPMTGEPRYNLETNLVVRSQVPARLKKLPKPKPSSGQEVA